MTLKESRGISGVYAEPCQIYFLKNHVRELPFVSELQLLLTTITLSMASFCFFNLVSGGSRSFQVVQAHSNLFQVVPACSSSFLVLVCMFKVNGKQRIIMPKKVNMLIIIRKIKSPFIIYADFESILVPEDNGKQNPEESYTNKYQKHIACSYGYKLVCVDDKFSKPFKTFLGKDPVYNFINSMFEESRYFIDVMKNILTKNL